jgi:hypothetical protein
MKHASGCFVVVMLSNWLVPAAADAAVRSYEFAGTVGVIADYSSLGYVPAAIHSGDPFVGSITYNDAVASDFTNSNGAGYSGTALDMSMSVTIDNAYTYALATPTANDQIIIDGTTFELFKRGPTVYTDFAPDPPFSHLDFEGITQSTNLSTATITGILQFGANGVSDQQTNNAPYYYVGLNPTSIQAIPEPASDSVLTLAAIGLLKRRVRGVRLQLRGSVVP